MLLWKILDRDQVKILKYSAKKFEYYKPLMYAKQETCFGYEKSYQRREEETENERKRMALSNRKTVIWPLLLVW